MREESQSGTKWFILGGYSGTWRIPCTTFRGGKPRRKAPGATNGISTDQIPSWQGNWLNRILYNWYLETLSMLEGNWTCANGRDRGYSVNGDTRGDQKARSARLTDQRWPTFSHFKYWTTCKERTRTSGHFHADNHDIRNVCAVKWYINGRLGRMR